METLETRIRARIEELQESLVFDRRTCADLEVGEPEGARLSYLESLYVRINHTEIQLGELTRLLSEE